jgi:hypothetical protein
MAMKYATKAQIGKIYVLLSNLNLTADKAVLVENWTNGRTSSTREMYLEEAKRLIARLCEFDPKERIKSAINQLAFRAGITYGNTEEDKILNKVKLDLFLLQKGTVKKPLEKQCYPELVKTHRQFEAILRNTNKSKDKKTADNAVKNLLNELNLITQ